MFDARYVCALIWTGTKKGFSTVSKTTPPATRAGACWTSCTPSGMDLEELRRTVAEDKLVLAPVARALSSEARYTAREIAERAGVELEFLTASRRALGLPVPDPDERVYGETDLEATELGTLHRQAGFADEDALEVARVLGQGMARYAESTRALVAHTFIEPGLDEYELAHRYRAVAEQLMPLAGPWLEHVFALHLQQVLRSDALTQEQRRAGKLDDTQQAVIAFADLVGFTALGESVPVEELGSVAGRLNRLAGEALEPPVRIVKLIGDAVMLVSPAARADGRRHAAPRRHGGRGRGVPAAAGRDRLRAGGAPLGRLVRHAGQPREPPHHPRAAVDRPRRRGGQDALDGRFDFSDAGRKKLKGFSAPVRAYRARRSADAAP